MRWRIMAWTFPCFPYSYRNTAFSQSKLTFSKCYFIKFNWILASCSWSFLSRKAALRRPISVFLEPVVLLFQLVKAKKAQDFGSQVIQVGIWRWTMWSWTMWSWRFASCTRHTLSNKFTLMFWRRRSKPEWASLFFWHAFWACCLVMSGLIRSAY